MEFNNFQLVQLFWFVKTKIQVSKQFCILFSFLIMIVYNKNQQENNLLFSFSDDDFYS